MWFWSCEFVFSALHITWSVLTMIISQLGHSCHLLLNRPWGFIRWYSSTCRFTHATSIISLVKATDRQERKEEGQENVLVMIKGIVTIISLDPPLLLRNLISPAVRTVTRISLWLRFLEFSLYRSFSALVRQSLYFTCICFVYALCSHVGCSTGFSMLHFNSTLYKIVVLFSLLSTKAVHPTWLFCHDLSVQLA